MRRLLLASVLLVLPPLLGSRASAGPDRTGLEWTLDVSGPTLIHLDPRKVPSMSGRSIVAYAQGDAADRLLVAPARSPDHLDFVAPRTGGPRRYLFVNEAPFTMPIATVLDDDAVATERFTYAEDRVFGAVAAADPTVYDRPFPLWYLAKLDPAGSTDVAIGLPSPGPVGDAVVVVRATLAPTHGGEVRIQATWGSKDLGTVTATRGESLSTVTFTCSGSDVPAAGVALRLTDRTGELPPRHPQDVSDDRGAVWIDSVVVEAPLSFVNSPV